MPPDSQLPDADADRPANEGRVVRLLRAASRIDPTPADHAAADARIRASLADVAEKSIPRRPALRFLRRPRVLALGLAASLAVVVAGVAFVLVFAARPQTALANLVAAAEASGRFRGWVSLQYEGSELPAMAYDTELSSWATYFPKSKDREAGVRLQDRRQMTDSYWSKTDNTVYVAEVDPTAIWWSYDYLAKQNSTFAPDFKDVVRLLKDSSVASVEVKQVRDGALDRYDVERYFRDEAGRRELKPGESKTYWVDPKTGLIAKLRFPGRGEIPPASLTYRYNDPAIRDVYDMGVPRDAKVVDRRPTGELKARLDAADRRVASGTGDGVALVTTVIRDQATVPADYWEPDKLELYAQSGDRWAYARYEVGIPPRRGAATRPEAVTRPTVATRPGSDTPRDGSSASLERKTEFATLPGWPDLSPATAVALVKDVVPSEVVVRDGGQTHVYQGNWVETRPHSPMDEALWGFPGRVWPGRYELWNYVPWATVSLRKDVGDAETLTYDIRWTGRGPYEVNAVTSDLKTGLPTSVLKTGLTAERKERWSVRTTFTSNIRTPAGVALPERWSTERQSVPAEAWNARPADGRLQFDPALKVPDSWFKSPEKRFGLRATSP